MNETRKCPKCSGEMEEGSPKQGVFGSQTWIKKGKATIFGAPSFKTYSCLQCGYIEAYVDRSADQ